MRDDNIQDAMTITDGKSIKKSAERMTHNMEIIIQDLCLIHGKWDVKAVEIGIVRWSW